MVDLLIAHGANPNHGDSRGKTALMRAALGGKGTMVEHLLKAKADVNRTDVNGWTTLMCAAAGDASVVERLIEAGAVTEATASGHAAVIDMIESETRIRAKLRWRQCAIVDGAFPGSAN
jgi:ankyrin repeat protein